MSAKNNTFIRRFRSSGDQSSDEDSSEAEGGISTSEQSYQDALSLAGKRVIIGGVGGSICVDPNDRRTVTTSFRKGTLLEIELVDDEEKYSEERGLVAFRVVGSEKYLSVVLYGDEARNATAEALSQTPLLPSHIPDIVDFVVDRPTAEGSFNEGAGFNYSPMTAEDGPPGPLQVFTLEKQTQCYGGDKYGIKSRFQTYWRSQHWNKTVSQSPHCLGDERWRFTIQEDEEAKKRKAILSFRRKCA